MNCWKCGEPTEHGAAECATCETGFKLPEKLFSEEDFDKIEWLEIDWDKIRTLEDMKFILREVGLCDIVMKDSPTAKRLQRFLKECE